MPRRDSRAGLARELFDEQAHREVDTKCADLIPAQIVDHRVGDLDCPAGGLDSGELGGVGADKIRLDCCPKGA